MFSTNQAKIYMYMYIIYIYIYMFAGVLIPVEPGLCKMERRSHGSPLSSSRQFGRVGSVPRSFEASLGGSVFGASWLRARAEVLGDVLKDSPWQLQDTQDLA